VSSFNPSEVCLALGSGDCVVSVALPGLSDRMDALSTLLKWLCFDFAHSVGQKGNDNVIIVMQEISRVFATHPVSYCRITPKRGAGGTASYLLLSSLARSLPAFRTFFAVLIGSCSSNFHSANPAHLARCRSCQSQ
jgi:hypothetical protein